MLAFSKNKKKPVWLVLVNVCIKREKKEGKGKGAEGRWTESER